MSYYENSSNSVDREGRKFDPKKKRKIQLAPRNTRNTEARSLLSLVIEYRSFIKHLAKKAAPLYAVTVENRNSGQLLVISHTRKLEVFITKYGTCRRLSRTCDMNFDDIQCENLCSF